MKQVKKRRRKGEEIGLKTDANISSSQKTFNMKPKNTDDLPMVDPKDVKKDKRKRKTKEMEDDFAYLKKHMNMEKKKAGQLMKNSKAIVCVGGVRLDQNPCIEDHLRFSDIEEDIKNNTKDKKSKGNTSVNSRGFGVTIPVKKEMDVLFTTSSYDALEELGKERQSNLAQGFVSILSKVNISTHEINSQTMTDIRALLETTMLEWTNDIKIFERCIGQVGL